MYSRLTPLPRSNNTAQDIWQHGSSNRFMSQVSYFLFSLRNYNQNTWQRGDSH